MPTVWRLIAHHDNRDCAVSLYKEQACIAIGWGLIGDLSRRSDLVQPSDIGRVIREIKSYRRLRNSHDGGPSLWNLLVEMDVGDLVILGTWGQRVSVLEIKGEYHYSKRFDRLLEGHYRHLRAARRTTL